MTTERTWPGMGLPGAFPRSHRGRQEDVLIFDRLRDYFQDIANALVDEKSAASIFPNATDKGMSREDILMDFLIDHLPSRCHAIKGGFIFDAVGNESKQIDLIVTNDLTLQFKQFDKPGRRGKSFNCVEGCYCAISVKTTLAQPHLEDALLNIASIPAMPDPGQRLNLFLSHREMFQDLPYKVVLAFEGPSVDTLCSHIERFYASSPIPHNRRPDLIAVINKYVVVHVGSEGARTRDGTPIPPFTFHPVTANYVGAYSLIYLLTKIQSSANFGSQLFMTFDEYLDKMQF